MTRDVFNRRCRVWKSDDDDVKGQLSTQLCTQQSPDTCSGNRATGVRQPGSSLENQVTVQGPDSDTSQISLATSSIARPVDMRRPHVVQTPFVAAHENLLGLQTGELVFVHEPPEGKFPPSERYVYAWKPVYGWCPFENVVETWLNCHWQK